MTTTNAAKDYAKIIFDDACYHLDVAITRSYLNRNDETYSALCDFREDLHTIIYQHFGLSYGREDKSEQPINDIMGVFEEFINDCREMGFDRLS